MIPLKEWKTPIVPLLSEIRRREKTTTVLLELHAPLRDNLQRRNFFVALSEFGMDIAFIRAISRRLCCSKWRSSRAAWLPIGFGWPRLPPRCRPGSDPRWLSAFAVCPRLRLGGRRRLCKCDRTSAEPTLFRLRLPFEREIDKGNWSIGYVTLNCILSDHLLTINNDWFDCWIYWSI